jgi:predicted transglutaminase-like cysteine proteinase
MRALLCLLLALLLGTEAAHAACLPKPVVPGLVVEQPQLYRAPAYSTSHIPLGPEGFKPAAADDACRRMPWSCRVQGKGPKSPKLAPRGSDMMAMNIQTNQTITYVSDDLNYCKSDFWALPLVTHTGDCEDYALFNMWLVRHRYRATVFLAFVLTEYGEGHAVLVWRTAAGDWLFDNRNDAMVRWDKANYTFISTQDPANPRVWRKVIQPDGRPLSD